jgi:hypothetical protein
LTTTPIGETQAEMKAGAITAVAWTVLAASAASYAKTTGPIPCRGKLKILGWSAGGDAFAFAGCAGDSAYVLDARTSGLTVLDGDAWKAWTKSHHLLGARPSRTSTDGRTMLEVEGVEHTSGGRWEDNVFRPTDPSVYDFVVRRKEKRTLSVAWISAAFQVEPHWSPDRRRIAWVVRTSRASAPAVYEIAVGPAVGPRVALIVKESASSGQLISSVAQDLAQGGFAPVLASTEVRAPPRSIVRASRGFEVEARDISQIVSDHPLVEPLSHALGSDLIVEVGESVLPITRAPLPLEPSRKAIRTFYTWTLDGRFLIEVEQKQEGEEEEEEEEERDEEEGRAIVVDPRTGLEESYALRSVGENEGIAGRSEALDRFLALHPLAPHKAARSSPDGRGTAEVAFGAGAPRGRWSGGAWTATASPEWSLTVRNGGELPSASAVGGTALTPYWSPDGTRIAWIVSHAAHGQRDVGFEDLEIGAASSGAIGLSIDRARHALLAPAVADLLEKSGRVVVPIQSMERRDRTRVLARPPFAATAAKIAAQIPGGASVGPLDARKSLDMIVVLGSKAGP